MDRIYRKGLQHKGVPEKLLQPTFILLVVDLGVIRSFRAQVFFPHKMILIKRTFIITYTNHDSEASYLDV